MSAHFNIFSSFGFGIGFGIGFDIAILVLISVSILVSVETKIFFQFLYRFWQKRKMAEIKKNLSVVPFAKPKNGDGKICFQWIFLGRTEKQNLVFRPIQH